MPWCWLVAVSLTQLPEDPNEAFSTARQVIAAQETRLTNLDLEISSLHQRPGGFRVEELRSERRDGTRYRIQTQFRQATSGQGMIQGFSNRSFDGTRHYSYDSDFKTLVVQARGDDSSSKFLTTIYRLPHDQPSLSAMLETPLPEWQATWIEHEGERLLSLERGSKESALYRYWLHPAYGWQPRRITFEAEWTAEIVPSNVCGNTLDSWVREYHGEDGIFLPKVVESVVEHIRCDGTVALFARNRCVLTKLDLSPVISEADFQVLVPRGTRIDDQVHQIVSISGIPGSGWLATQVGFDRAKMILDPRVWMLGSAATFLLGLWLVRRRRLSPGKV